MIAAGLSCTGEGIPPSDTPGTLTGWSSPICFLLPACCFVPRDPSGITEGLGCVRRIYTGIETYPEDQRLPMSGGDVSSLVCVPVAPITSPEKCMYSSEGENIPLCLFLFNIVYTENGETHLLPSCTI